MGRTPRPTSADGPAAAARGEAVELGVLGTAIAFHLRLAQGASFRAFKRQAGLRNLRPGWYAMLTLIANNPGITPVALSRASGRDKSTITPALGNLLREKLISREAVPGDRRSYGLALTPAGVETLRLLAAAAEAHDRELDAIAGAGKPALLEMLRRIIAELD